MWSHSSQPRKTLPAHHFASHLDFDTLALPSTQLRMCTAGQTCSLHQEAHMKGHLRERRSRAACEQDTHTPFMVRPSQHTQDLSQALIKQKIKCFLGREEFHHSEQPPTSPISTSKGHPSKHFFPMYGRQLISPKDRSPGQHKHTHYWAGHVQGSWERLL